MKLWTRKCHPDYVVDVKHTRLTRCDVKVPRKNSNKNSSSAIRIKNQIWMQCWEGLKHKAGNKNIDICISNQMLQGFHFDKLLETIAAMAISKTSFLFLFFEKRKKIVSSWGRGPYHSISCMLVWEFVSLKYSWLLLLLICVSFACAIYIETTTTNTSNNNHKKQQQWNTHTHTKQSAISSKKHNT